ncbi:helix-turn-helix domain-containing protein [Streptomyces sp. YS415]|uniref:winged helix-turn-helix transcriptional regulator n=1 Tax=Streptomyces sp. YS415 TaxID=2944806 RepID=UPI002020AD44|nr:helix-turn-helix domain-containing protein [Streptomyces sp. YS415]MCL7426884.1 helix-turn-helix transcriptional regulator [Streptomyces sp. YS415]
MSAPNTAVSSQLSTPVPEGPCGDDDCGIREVLDRLGDRWTVLVVVELAKGSRRYGELERAVPGISQRMLSLTTKRLCRDGLVERIVHPTLPPQVEYRLTDMGSSLSGMISGLADWSRDHKPAIAAARAAWDAEHTGRPALPGTGLPAPS